ncbi:MAG: terminase large subunit domain-containing protein, partial [Rhodospirillaceae bacterium]
NRRLLTEHRSGRAIDRLYPEDGPLRRDLYPKHLEFFAAGLHHDERAFVAGNRVGKTMCVCYEATLHLTGEYPEWWEGRRWDRPIVAWAAGEDVKAVRESLQPALLGPAEARGTGLIPRDRLERAPARGGVPDAVDFVEIRHAAGGVSRLLFKAYEQGRESFQSARIDIGLLDEEPPLPIYTEVLTRTLSTVPGERNGAILAAFTPLKGVSDTVLQFLPGGQFPASDDERRKAWGW